MKLDENGVVDIKIVKNLLPHFMIYKKTQNHKQAAISVNLIWKNDVKFYLLERTNKNHFIIINTLLILTFFPDTQKTIYRIT